MSDDWKPGDLALCVNDTRSPAWPDCLVRKGVVYTVAAVGPILPHRLFNRPCRVLHLVGVIDTAGYGCLRFRKINPLTDEERDEFLADLKQPGRIEA